MRINELPCHDCGELFPTSQLTEDGLCESCHLARIEERDEKLAFEDENAPVKAIVVEFTPVQFNPQIIIL